MAASICDVFAFCVKPEDARRVAEIRFINSGKGNGLFPHPSSHTQNFALSRMVCTSSVLDARCHTVALNVSKLQQSSITRSSVLELPGITHLILLNKREEAWRNIHYPPETASIMLIARMVATIKQAKDKDWWLYLFSQFCSKTANEEEEIVHKLLGDKFKGQLEQLRQLFMEALHDERVNNIILASVSCGIIGTGSPSQWVHACDALNLPARERAQLDTNCEGSGGGFYMLQSCCNHSCLPNAEASFPDNNFLLHLNALQDIKPGEEICISYLDCCQRERSRHTEDPDVTSEEEDAELDGETDDAELEDEMTDV
uniref:SET domain-containing protein n=1 Tax=Leptobrachium leishanense TaxID=445787 RepID=A0A8C5N2Y8_9ANUR